MSANDAMVETHQTFAALAPTPATGQGSIAGGVIVVTSYRADRGAPRCTPQHRRNWLDLNAVYCMPIGPTATRYVAAGEIRIFEKFEDLPPAGDKADDINHCPARRRDRRKAHFRATLKVF